MIDSIMAGLGLRVGWEIELNFLMAFRMSSIFVPKGSNYSLDRILVDLINLVVTQKC